MSWLFSRVLAEEYLGGTSLDGEQSAQSSGNPTQQAYCAPDKMTAFSRLSRFGMTYKPLTEDRGEALLTLYREVFHAKTLAQPGGGAGIDGERSGMWKEMARVVHEVRPRFVFVENSPMLTSRGLGTVLGDLASLGFDAKWGVLGAADVGAPHRRDRIWIVANTQELLCNGGNHNPRKLLGREQISEFGNGSGEENVPDTDGSQCQRNQRTKRSIKERANIGQQGWWEVEPDVGRVADGVAARVDRLKAIGNGQVPEVARRAWQLLIN